MTDFHHTGEFHGEGPPAAGPLQAVVNWAGALVSLALLAGIGFWGYQLAVRDVSGVPVVQALEGPMRIAPEDPGGRQAAYQGLAVNAVAAIGEAAALPDEIVLAPRPIDLASEDTPGGAPGGAAAPGARGASNGTARAEAVTQVSFAPVEAASAVTRVVSDASTRGADAPLREQAELRVIPANVPGVARSPRPPVRPDVDLVALNAAESAARMLAARNAGVDVDPDTLTPGMRLVQLGAFDDAQTARDEWDRLARRFAAHMEGLGRVVQTAESGGRTFYRLRASGFEDEAAARRFCAVLLAENAACIPVLIR